MTDNYYTHFDVSEVTFDDIHQTGELLKLQGKTPNHSLIRTKLSNEGLLTYDFLEELPPQAEPICWADHNPDPEIVFQLANWALQQSAEIREKILDFLDYPTDQQADQIIEFLSDQGLLPEPSPPLHREQSLADIIYHELETRKQMTIEQIYELEYVICSKRPRAAIRQALRRLLDKESIKRDPHGNYFLS